MAGQWKYLYRAVDKAGDTVDFLLTAKCDKAAAQHYLERAINLHGLPERITIDKSGANTAAIHSVNAGACLAIELHQSKYVNNIVEQDHRAVKRITNPRLGLKSLWSAQKRIAEIETMHMIKKGQLHFPDRQAMSAADQFYSLAFCIWFNPVYLGHTTLMRKNRSHSLIHLGQQGYVNSGVYLGNANSGARYCLTKSAPATQRDTSRVT